MFSLSSSNLIIVLIRQFHLQYVLSRLLMHVINALLHLRAFHHVLHLYLAILLFYKISNTATLELFQHSLWCACLPVSCLDLQIPEFSAAWANKMCIFGVILNWSTCQMYSNEF